MGVDLWDTGHWHSTVGTASPSFPGLSHERKSEVTIMLTDAENQILFLSLKSLDWLPTRPIDTKIVIDQIRGDSILKAMPYARSVTSKLGKISDEEARRHFELLLGKRSEVPATLPAQGLQRNV
jgi:hypothetical protein